MRRAPQRLSACPEPVRALPGDRGCTGVLSTTAQQLPEPGPWAERPETGSKNRTDKPRGWKGGTGGGGLGQGGKPGDLLRGLWCLQRSPAAARRAKVTIIPDDCGGSVTPPALRGRESEPSHKSQAAEPPLNPLETPHHGGLLETPWLQRGEEQPFPNKCSNPSCPTVPSSTPPTAVHLRN